MYWGTGYVFGALWETQGDCWTQCYPGRTIPNCIDFLSYVDSQVPTSIERVYAIMDNLNVHHCNDVLLFLLNHPRWEMVYQPKIRRLSQFDRTVVEDSTLARLERTPLPDMAGACRCC